MRSRADGNRCPHITCLAVINRGRSIIDPGQRAFSSLLRGSNCPGSMPATRRETAPGSWLLESGVAA